MKATIDEKRMIAEAIAAENRRQFQRSRRIKQARAARNNSNNSQLPEKSNFSRNCGNKRIRHQKGNKIIQGVSHAG